MNRCLLLLFSSHSVSNIWTKHDRQFKSVTVSVRFVSVHLSASEREAWPTALRFFLFRASLDKFGFLFDFSFVQYPWYIAIESDMSACGE